MYTRTTRELAPFPKSHQNSKRLELLRLGALLAGSGLAGGGCRLLWQQHSLDVWQHAALGDGHARKKLVELLVIAHSQLQVAGDDARLFVVSGCISRQLQNLGGQILENSGEVDRSASTNSLGVVPATQKTMDSADWELKTGTA